MFETILTEENRERCNRIFGHFGATKQTLKLAEESSELASQSVKHVLSQNHPSDILNEMVDVLILTMQLVDSGELDTEDMTAIEHLEMMMAIKLNRTEKRIKEQKHGEYSNGC